MTCTPISEEQKKVWIEWLELLVDILNEKPETKIENTVFRTVEGDMNTAKLLTGTLLATLKNDVVTIK